MIRQLRRNRRGAAAAEFALTIPIAVVILFGIIQLGVAFWANAGVQNGLGEAARVATLWPRRSDAEIRARLTGSAFGVNPAGLTISPFVPGTAGGQDFIDINVAYQTRLNFVLFEIPVVTINHSRRAYRP
jgi:Flp pilus assembly protein TadG